MVNYLNKHNKHHFALYKMGDALYAYPGNLTWLEILLYKAPERLNVRISKLSPRRGKKHAQDLVKGFAGSIARELEKALEIALTEE